MSWKAQARRLVNRALEPAGFTLRRFQPELHVRAMESLGSTRFQRKPGRSSRQQSQDHADSADSLHT